MKYFIIASLVFGTAIIANGQNARELTQNRLQINQGKTNLDRDSREISKLRKKLSIYDEGDGAFASLFASDFEREIQQTEAKLRQSSREVRQSGSELRSEKREIRDDRRQIRSGGPGNKRDVANLRNDRRDKRDDKADRRDDYRDRERVEMLLATQKKLFADFQSNPNKQSVQELINTMVKDIELTRMELSEDRVEGLEDRRERGEDRRERREKVY